MAFNYISVDYNGEIFSFRRSKSEEPQYIDGVYNPIADFDRRWLSMEEDGALMEGEMFITSSKSGFKAVKQLMKSLRGSVPSVQLFLCEEHGYYVSNTFKVLWDFKRVEKKVSFNLEIPAKGDKALSSERDLPTLQQINTMNYILVFVPKQEGASV